MDKSISPTYRDSAENFSRYIDCLRRRSSITSALPVGVTQQQQSSRPSKRCSEAPTLAGHRGSDGDYVARILQPPISCSETRRFIPSHHRLEEVEPVPRCSVIQNGNSLLHNSSISTPRMDNEDRLERRIPSYLGTRQYPKIFPVCSSRNSFSIPGPPVWTINSSTGIHQVSSTCDSAASFPRYPGPRLPGRLDNSCYISGTEPGTYSTCFTTSTITGMDNQLGQINVTTIQNSGFSGSTFQLRTSPHVSSGLVLTYSHRGPLPSISINSHVCSEGLIHHQPDVSLCPIYNQWPSTSPFPPVWVQTPVDSTQTVMGHPNPAGFGLPILPTLVSQSISDERGSVTSSGPQSLLLHGCFPQRLGSQLERPSDLRNMVSYRFPTSHQLVGTRGDSTSSTSMGPSVDKSNCESLLRQQYRSSIHPQTRGNSFPASISKDSGIIQSPGSVYDNSHTHTPPRSQERHRRCSVTSQSTQSNRMASSNRNLEQTVLCLRNSPDRHVCHSGEQGDARLCFSLPGRQSMDGRRPVPIMGRLGPNICISSGSHCSQDHPENPKVLGHHGHLDRLSTSVTTVAPTSAPVEHTSQDSPPRRSPAPVCAQPQTPSVPPRSQTIGSSRVALIRDVLKSHHFPDTVVDMAADPLRDSSSNVYNSHWKAFALWANNKGICPNDLSFITLAEYLVYLFSQNKKVNTILVPKASISSVLKLLNPPMAIQESTLHNVIRRMNILRPREQEVLPRWHLSVVLKGLMKPPFAINGTDRHISLELLSYKTAFLVALASGARGSEMVTLSRASHNLEFTTLASGAKQVSIRMVPKFIPKNQRPEIIPEPIKFPGMAHLFPNESERLLCPVRALGLYIVKSAERAQNDPLEKLFVHFTPETQLFTTHFRRWVAETIRLTYENSSQSGFPRRSEHMTSGVYPHR